MTDLSPPPMPPAEIWPFTKVVPYIRLDSTVGPTIAYVTHHYGVDDGDSFKHDVWYGLDLTKHGVPAAAVAIETRTKLIITNNSKLVTADLRGYLGKVADPLIESWEIHAVAVMGTGTRQSQSGSVPVTDGTLKFRWSGTLDVGISYGMTVMLTGYYMRAP